MSIVAWLGLAIAHAAAPPWPGVGPATAPGVVVPAEVPLHATSLPSTARFVPDAAEIARLELALVRALKNPSPSHRGLGARIPADRPGYHAQYSGWIVDGKRLVHGSYLYDPDGKRFPAWKSAEVDVDDGGNDFFEVIYEPSTDTVVSLDPHGEG